LRKIQEEEIRKKPNSRTKTVVTKKIMRDIRKTERKKGKKERKERKKNQT